MSHFLPRDGKQRMCLRLGLAVAALTLCTPAFGLTAISPTDPSLQGTTIAAQTFTIDAQDSGEPVPPPVPVFFVDEKIVQNTTGTLDFYFKLRNFSTPQPLRYFFVLYPSSIQATAFYLDEGNLAPTGAYTFGGVNDIVGPTLGSGGTDTLLLRTDANAYTSGTVEAFRLSFDDFDIQPGTGLVPAANSVGSSAVPEPTGFALLSLAVIGLTIKFRS